LNHPDEMFDDKELATELLSLEELDFVVDNMEVECNKFEKYSTAFSARVQNLIRSVSPSKHVQFCFRFCHAIRIGLTS